MNGAQILRQFETLKNKRQPLEYIWRECYRVTFPERGRSLTTGRPGVADSSQNQTDQARIYDNTAADACKVLASALVSGLTPSNSIWAYIETMNEELPTAAATWLEEASRRLHKDIHASNFDAANFEAMLDVVVTGMCCLFIDQTDDAPYHFELWDLGSCYFASSLRNGPIDIIYHPFRISALQAVNEYGDQVSTKTREILKRDPFTLVDFVLAITPRPAADMKTVKGQALPYVSHHIELDTQQIVKESGFHELPVVVPRWVKIPGSDYATGPMSAALPDTKTLNEVERLVLANADMAIAGMWGAVDDGVLNPRTVRVGARKIVFMRDKESFFPLASGGKFDVSAIISQDKRASIRRSLMADQLEPLQGGPARTATEVAARVNQVRMLLGPNYGRLQAEYLQRLVFRCFGISLRRGDLGQPPPELQDHSLRLKYVSPLARSQRMEDVAAMEHLEMSLLNIGKMGLTGVLDGYDWDEAQRTKGQLLGVPGVLLLDDKQVGTLREERQKAQQAQQQAQQPTTPASPSAVAGQPPETGPGPGETPDAGGMAEIMKLLGTNHG